MTSDAYVPASCMLFEILYNFKLKKKTKWDIKVLEGFPSGSVLSFRILLQKVIDFGQTRIFSLVEGEGVTRH